METVFSGIQPSGELHLGNYLGAIRNWVRIQDATTDSGQNKYRCFFCVVDYHAITQNYDPSILARRTLEMATDLLACGVDPQRATLFVQSCVPEHTELAWVLSAVTPYGELGRMTQFKDKSEAAADYVNVGLFTYPVLQAADITLYKARRVPVGQDQLQHLELAREIVRKLNRKWELSFPEPEALLSETPKLLGLDGQAKMSKSLGNTIGLGEDADAIWAKLAPAATDPARARRKDPGNPDVCNVFTLHKFFTPPAEQLEVREGCTTAGIGCFDCKKKLHGHLVTHLAPIGERRRSLQAKPDQVKELLVSGAKEARKEASANMAEVRERVGLLPVG